MSRTELGIEINENDLGPFGYIDIAPIATRETVLVAYTNLDFSVGCVLLKDDRSLVVRYQSPATEREMRDGLQIMDGLTWAEGHLMAAQALQQWVDGIHNKRIPISPVLKYHQNVSEPNRFTNIDGQSVTDITNAINNLKMQRMSRSGHYIPIKDLIDLSPQQ